MLDLVYACDCLGASNLDVNRGDLGLHYLSSVLFLQICIRMLILSVDSNLDILVHSTRLITN